MGSIQGDEFDELVESANRQMTHVTRVISTCKSAIARLTEENQALKHQCAASNEECKDLKTRFGKTMHDLEFMTNKLSMMEKKQRHLEGLLARREKEMEAKVKEKAEQLNAAQMGEMHANKRAAEYMDQVEVYKRKASKLSADHSKFQGKLSNVLKFAATELDSLDHSVKELIGCGTNSNDAAGQAPQ